MAVFLCAVLFDMFYEGPRKQEHIPHQGSESQTGYAPVYFYNPAGNFKLVRGVDKFFSRLVFPVSPNEFLAEQYSCKVFHTLKAVSITAGDLVWKQVHFRKFNTCHPAVPDEEPPVRA